MYACIQQLTSTLHSAQWRKLRLSGILLFCAALGACGIKPVVVSELATANGYQVEMAYQADTDLILTHVRVEMTMSVNGALVRTVEQDYWEYFVLKKLKASDENNWAASQWPSVREFVEEKFFYQDLIRAGPLLAVGTLPPQQFLIKIRQTHALYIGGKIQGNVPRGQFHGSFGYIQQDATGNTFVVRRVDASGTTDDSQLWANQNQPAGRVLNAGEQVQTLVLEHEAAWGQVQGETDWGVEWKYVRNFGDARFERRGSDIHQTPQAGP